MLNVLKTNRWLCAGIIPLLAFTGCGVREEDRQVLRIYNWLDYFDPDVLKRFEERFKCEVEIEVFDSNEEMQAVLKLAETKYDLVFPSTYAAVTLWEEGLLRRIDPQLVPNLKNIDRGFQERFAADPECVYSVPYMVGTTGIAYRVAAFEQGEMPSWNFFGRPQVNGRGSLLNDMRETIGAALKMLGHSLNTRDAGQIEAAGALVKEWRRNVPYLYNERYKQGITSREFIIVHAYSGDVLELIDELPDLVYALPEEGYSLWVDNVSISLAAPNPDLAHAFINFLLEPEIAALNMEYCWYYSPNQAAYPLVDADLLDDPNIFFSDELKDGAEQILPVGDAQEVYERVWQSIVP